MVVLYGINLSTFTRKVRLALAEKGIGYRLEPAAMGSPKVRALHPLGKIPVIEHDGTVVPDSSVIIAYLEKAFPDSAPLYPAAAPELARALWLEEYADTRLREATVPFFAERVVKPLFQRKPGDETALATAATACSECFDYLERELAGRFALGDALTVADVALGAQLVTYQQGGGQVDPDRWPRLHGYMAGLRERTAWAELIAEENAALAAARARAG